MADLHTALRSLGLLMAINQRGFDIDAKKPIAKAAKRSAEFFRTLSEVSNESRKPSNYKITRTHRLIKYPSLLTRQELYTVPRDPITRQLVLWDGVQEEPEDFTLEDYPQTIPLDPGVRHTGRDFTNNKYRDDQYWVAIDQFGFKKIIFYWKEYWIPIRGMTSLGKIKPYCKPLAHQRHPHSKVVNLYMGRKPAYRSRTGRRKGAKLSILARAHRGIRPELYSR